MELLGNHGPEELITGLNPDQIVNQFRELLQAEQGKSPHSVGEVARKIGKSRRSYQRILAGKTSLSAHLLISIGAELGIDKARATCAIEHFHDWRRYNDPTLIVAFDLLKPVVENINESDAPVLEPLHPLANGQLGGWIAKMVVDHCAQICARREALDLIRTR